ncbi:hypothetical protein [Pseudonocardia sp. H11422]|uniref:hypothetical protein n=1 Tax=Pseudonocardia sp. H11422 TaxID=2835866 RepID=UPI001BDCA398|nr:hypothetical protein [Pseudonocardia sp. H11422]
MDSLGEVEETTNAPTSTTETAAAAEAAKSSEQASDRPVRRRSAPHKTTRGEESSGTARPTSRARKPAAKKPAAARTEPAPEAPASPAPRVLIPTTTEAKRAGLYLHADDYRELGMAKLNDGADLNARIRAMIALWRSNERYRNAVDKLARTSPRGPGRG